MIDTLEKLISAMRGLGVERLYAKKLSPNDNSKNQIYLGGDFSVLNVIPYGNVRTDDNIAYGSVRQRAKAAVDLYWLSETGTERARDAQLILYPKYPEVRLSGILKGCKTAPSEILRNRDEGRVLFLGVTAGTTILAFAINAESLLARAFSSLRDLRDVGVFVEIPTTRGQINSKDRLLSVLEAIYQKNWIYSKKLGRDGLAEAYSARNGGGYTLEAELGISPNGFSEPDYLGWEIKQFGVKDFIKFRAKSAVTLMTPEPNGGIYRDQGLNEFMERYAYDDKSGTVGRRNFGGIYACNRDINKNTGLRLRLAGYDPLKSKITDLNGGIELVDRNEVVAASWKFSSVIEHWNRKHAQAAYVPSLFKSPPPFYRFGPQILLCERTDLTLFLQAVSAGIVYYDPAIKIEKNDGSPDTAKKRSQFRIKHADVIKMYQHHEIITFET